MKKTITLMFVAGTWLLAGCCTTSHATKQWEYKLAYPTPSGPAGLQRENQQQALNELGQDGWALVAVDPQTGLFYLKRPKQSR